MTNETASVPAPPEVDRNGPPTPATDAGEKRAVSDVASTAASEAKEAAREATTQAKVVADEAKRQVATVVDRTRQEVAREADQRARQAGEGLRSLADQVRALTEGRPGEAGSLPGYLDDARGRVTALADRLESAGPQGLIDDVAGFARRRPVVFLAAAAGAGFMVGRLARAGRAAQQDGSNVRDEAPMVLDAPTVLTDAPLASTVP